MTVRRFLAIAALVVVSVAGCGASGPVAQTPAKGKDFISPASDWQLMKLPSQSKASYRLVNITTEHGAYCAVQTDPSSGSVVPLTLLHNGGC